MLPIVVLCCTGYRSVSQEIVGVLMNSLFEYMDHALYGELMSQIDPDVTHQKWVLLGEFLS